MNLSRQFYNPLEGVIEDLFETPKDGDAGARGEAGPRGEKGERGEDGRPGLKGDPGRAGEIGIQGPVGPMGPQGERGEVGARGTDGKPGEPGLPGTNGNTIHYLQKPTTESLGVDGDIAINDFKELFLKEKGKWIFKGSLSGSGGSTALRLRSLSGIGNVKLTDLTIGDNLQWNGDHWTNSAEESVSDLSIQYDKVSSSVSYIGYADPGSALASAVWKIKKMTTTGDDIAITWADGNVNFDNVWNDRATLTYS